VIHVGLRPVAIFVYPLVGSITWKRGLVPRFVVVRSAFAKIVKRGNGVASALEIAFEREVGAIAHDRAFSGVEIVRSSAHARGSSTVLTVTIDKEGGVDLATCEAIAARLNAALESFTDPYSLEVESAGLERPLVRPADYERFKGKRVRVATSLTINGAKRHRGTLAGLQGENVMLTTESGPLTLPLATITSAHLEFDPRADLQRNKRERKNYGRTGN
jgi:ribosome maturation factor RimP